MAFTFHTGPYPTVGVPNTVTTGHDGADGSIKTGAGKLILSSSANVIHVSSSLDLGLVPESAYHIRAVNANLVLSSSAGSYVYASGNLTVEQAFLVKGDSVLSGNVVVGGQIYDLNSNLILSSSVGSVIAASGSLDFPQTDKTYHIRAVNGHLILSSSVGSVIVMSSSLDVTNVGNKNYHIRSINSDLILSSSAGSIVALSSNLYFPVDAPSLGAHIRAINTDLILSSSRATGYTTVSGSMRVLGAAAAPSTTTQFEVVEGQAGAVAIGIRSLGVGSSTGAWRGRIIAGGATAAFIMGEYNSQAWLGGHNAALSAWFPLRINPTGLTDLYLGNRGADGNPILTIHNALTSGAMGVATPGNIYGNACHLILSSSVGSVVALSSSQDLVNSDKSYHVRAVNSHLILSSTLGSIVQVSGGLLLAGTYTSATLPTAPPTGSIVYVSDLGFAAIYVSATEKYYRLSSGTF